MYNNVELIGRLGKDPQVKVFEDQNKIANFTLATTEVYNDRNGERQEKTEWHNVVVRGKRVQVAENYLKKGALVHISGPKRTRSYQDNQGNDRQIVEIIANRLTLLPSGSGGNQQAPASKAESNVNSYANDNANAGGGNAQPQPAGASNVQQNWDEEEDDLPF